MFDNDRTGIFCYLSILENEGKSNVKRAEVEKKVTTDFSSDCETGFDWRQDVCLEKRKVSKFKDQQTRN